MLFNSLDFGIFLCVSFVIYWNIGSTRIQNFFLLVCSYVFYAWWDWRFLGLIALSSLTDFVLGQAIHRVSKKRKRKLLLFSSLLINLGILGFFKYYNFFLNSLVDSFHSLGIELNLNSLSIILPVGISFYTFQSLSYTIDVYKGKAKPTQNLVNFFAYVSFFPQLVAGPIERAKNLLPQFAAKRTFDYPLAVDGLRQILWGLVKKVVIADNCGLYTSGIIENYANHSGSTLYLGICLFSFQIYCDFSGYSDIAIGTAKLFGFKLRRNFNFPYFSRNINEFWRRWHISLSSWFKDYVYIPLGGSKGSTLKSTRNLFIVFLVSGFWHGANWTFIAWGFFNALLYLPQYLNSSDSMHKKTDPEYHLFPCIKEFTSIALTFTAITLTWVFFVSESIGDSFEYFSILFSASLFTVPEILPKYTLMYIFIFTCIEWVQRDKEHALDLKSDEKYRLLRWGWYLFLCVCVLRNSMNQQEFIYFQF